MVDRIAIADEKGNISMVSYDELDPEFAGEFCKPVGAFTYDMSSFMRLPLADVPFYIDGWLPKMGKAEIFGPAKVGKSMLAVQAARCIGLGEPFLGMKTEQGRVLYMQFELGPKILQDRLRKTGASYENVYVGTSFSMMVDEEPGQKMLRAEIEAVTPNVLILDPLYKCMAGDENEGMDMKAVCNFLDTLIEDYSLSILLMHHTGKDTSRGGRGSSVLEGWVDSYIYMQGVETEKGVVRANLKPKRLRHAPTPDDPLPLVLGSNFEFDIGEKVVPVFDKVCEFAKEMGTFTFQDVIDAGLASRKYAYSVRAKLLESGQIKASPEKGMYEWVGSPITLTLEE